MEAKSLTRSNTIRSHSSLTTDRDACFSITSLREQLTGVGRGYLLQTATTACMDIVIGSRDMIMLSFLDDSCNASEF